MRRRVVLKRFALALGSTLVGLLLAELLLRLLSIGDPVLQDVDPVLGWAPVPGAEGWWTREGHAHVRITEHGFRGVDVPPGDPGDRLRVAVIGDSFVEACQVALCDAFPAHAERVLSECAGRPVEVLPFGVSGYGTAQEWRLYRHRVRRWHPQVVVLAFLSGNDVSNNHPVLAEGEPAPYFSLDAAGRLVLDDAFLRSDRYGGRAGRGPWRWLRRHSRLVRLLLSLSRPGRERQRGELGLRDEVYAPPASPEWEDAWARTEAMIAHLHRDVQREGARFRVVTLTTAAQVDPDPAVRAGIARTLGVPDLDYADRRVAAAGARDGYPVLTLAPVLRAHAEQERVHLHGFPNTEPGTGHWNETGHRVAGERLGAWLCEEPTPPQ